MITTYLLDDVDLKFYTTARNYMPEILFLPKVDLHYIININYNRKKPQNIKQLANETIDFVACNTVTMEIICCIQLSETDTISNPIRKALNNAGIALCVFPPKNYYKYEDFNPLRKFAKNYSRT